MSPAVLREVSARYGTEADRQRLQNNGKDIGHQDHKEKFVSCFSTRRDISRIVSWVNVCDGDEESGASKGCQMCHASCEPLHMHSQGL